MTGWQNFLASVGATVLVIGMVWLVVLALMAVDWLMRRRGRRARGTVSK